MEAPNWIIDAGIYLEAEELAKTDPVGADAMITEAKKQGYNPRPMDQCFPVSEKRIDRLINRLHSAGR